MSKLQSTANNNGSEVIALITKALKEIPADVELSSINSNVFDGARQNERRSAYLKIFCPDDWVKNLRGHDKFRDLYLSVKIPREFVDAWREKREVAKALVSSPPSEPEPLEVQPSSDPT